jgi:hypothetical protein
MGGRPAGREPPAALDPAPAAPGAGERARRLRDRGMRGDGLSPLSAQARALDARARLAPRSAAAPGLSPPAREALELARRQFDLRVEGRLAKGVAARAAMLGGQSGRPVRPPAQLRLAQDDDPRRLLGHGRSQAGVLRAGLGLPTSHAAPARQRAQSSHQKPVWPGLGLTQFAEPQCNAQLSCACGILFFLRFQRAANSEPTAQATGEILHCNLGA